MKNIKTKKELTLSVGIPTCYGGESLYETAKTIRVSKGVGEVPFMIVADRTPISKRLHEKLKKLHIKLVWNKKEGSQFKKFAQLIKACKSDIFVFTQDDVIFHPEAIQRIKQAFEADPNLTMVGVRVLPLPPSTFIESILATMIRLVDYIGRNWNNKNNHLLASGRCLAFRTSKLKTFRIPEKVVNGDMYLYLENKRLKGKFSFLEDAEIYIRPPQTLKDQIGPSSRYQFSQEELKNYFRFPIADEYRIPFTTLIKGLIHEILFHPVLSLCYLFVFGYTRLHKQPPAIVSNPVWKVDPSTKRTK